VRGLYRHTPTGKLVLINDGEYETSGGISNYYSGNVVDESGNVTKKTFGDYDNERGKWEKIKNYTLKVKINKK
jgi:hypothetical protein